MRFVVYGIGAVGGTVAARLHEAGHEVVGIARGAHLEAVRARGLELHTPTGSSVARFEAVGDPREITFGGEEVVLLTVKSQDTCGALQALAVAAPASTPVACLQNGVANEREALRRFADVYGAVVMCPTTFLDPGEVLAHSTPVTGLFDIGRYPHGTDARGAGIAAALAGATFDVREVPDVMRWKYGKLLGNLANTVVAVCGPDARRGPVARLAREEGRACLDAAGIAYVSDEEDRQRRGDILKPQDAGGRPRPAGSTWQSLARAAGSVEVDYFNGEIVLLGRLHGVPTPVNALLQRLAGELAASGSPPGTLDADAFMALLESEGATGTTGRSPT